MPETPRFLLGFGERLTAPVQVQRGGKEKTLPYTFNEARARLVPMLARVVSEFDGLPSAACPRGMAVATFTLHPQYLAKSYYPGTLLRALDLKPVGSRPTRVRPAAWSRKTSPQLDVATDLFIAGTRSDFRRWAQSLPDWSASNRGADELSRIEQLRPMGPEDRLKPIATREKHALFEIVLHASALPEDNFILEGFKSFLSGFDLSADFDRRLHAGGLCFVPLRAPKNLLPQIAKFSFLRAAREMPSLRPLTPPGSITRSAQSSVACVLPTQPPIDPKLRVAVFDGGLPPNAGIDNWTKAYDAPGIGKPRREYLAHGLGVTSAFLFGTLEGGATARRPFGAVDHYRVLDSSTGQNPYELYEVLHRIRDILQTRRYEFLNLSIGPAVPIEDDDVHPWTAVLDELLADGGALATIAVGNGGERDAKSGFNRIQVPADCVNGLSVGACDSRTTKWKRAQYSSVGPGRSPGVIKPDVVAYGGCDQEPFCVLDASKRGQVLATCGTSFSTPAVLRAAAGVRAHFGTVLSPLAIKSLIVHGSEEGLAGRSEIGWGRVPEEIDDLVICPDGVARVVYQGELTAAQYLRVQIPLPAQSLVGKVTIAATLCFASQTDAQDPGNYTRSGLDIIFRPDDTDHKKGKLHQESESFFRLKEYSTETELRHDAHKWETTLHRKRTFRGASLRNPVFDIHYQTRIEGQPTSAPGKIRYALVLTIQSLRTRDLYDQIMRRYRTHLQPLVPTIQIPVRT